VGGGGGGGESGIETTLDCEVHCTVQGCTNYDT